MAEMALAPYRILDLTGEIGQMCGRALAEMGATVIKIEPPGGDPVRSAGPFFDDEPGQESSLLWSMLNLSKQGITCDLEQPEGRALFRKLLAGCDMVIESCRPGYLSDLGLSHSDLLAEHPKLVWTSITGYGQDGPYRNFGWSDITGLALGGLMYLFGDADRPPVRARAAQAYYLTSMAAAYAATVALYHARRTGQGQHLDVSMQEVVTFGLAGPGGIAYSWPMMGVNVKRAGPSFPMIGYQTRIMYRCKDGWVAVAPFFTRTRIPSLVQAMKADNAAGFLEEPRWVTATRHKELPGLWRMTDEQAEAVENLVGEWLMMHTREEILQLARKFDLVLFPAYTVAENLQNEQLIERGYFQTAKAPGQARAVTYPGPAVRLTQTPWTVRGPAPALGENNDEVYGAIGISPSELQQLRERRVI